MLFFFFFLCSSSLDIEPALAAKFTFRFCDEDDDDVNDDLAVRANANVVFFFAGE